MAGEGAITRRQALSGGALAVGALAVDADPGWARRGQRAPEQLTPRSTLSFDEGWLFHYGDAPGAEAGGFDDRSWRALDLPHDWRVDDLPGATSQDGAASSDPAVFASITNPAMTATTPRRIGPFDADADPTGPTANGHGQGFTVSTVGWYRKHFTLPDLPAARVHGQQQRVELLFGGVYQNADVWLNGKHVAFHPNGYVSFALDLTPHLNAGGPNVLAVRVDSSGRTSRFYSGSGIYRHTWLTITGPVRMPRWGTVVTTPVVDETRSVAHVEVPVGNAGAGVVPALVRVRVVDDEGRTLAERTTAQRQVARGKTESFALDIPIAPARLWSPEAPNLYRLRAEVLVAGEVVDVETTTFGFRSIVVNGKQGFVLNGKPVKLRGGNVHIDHGALGTVSLYRSEERRVQTLKRLGFNAIRTAHNPPSAEFLAACDRVGMLVYDEFTDMWDSGKTDDDYSNYFAEWWERDLTGMVTRDRNHPSVVIWSLGNEIPNDDNNYGPRMAALVRKLDKTRPLTVGGTLNDAVWAYVDFGDRHYVSDYGSDHNSHPDKALNQSESLPPDVYRVWKLVEDNVYAIGDFPWTAWDYLGETSVGVTPIQPVGVTPVGLAAGAAGVAGAYPFPWFQAYCGDVDLIGQRKPQSYWRSVVWGFSELEMAVERPTPPGTEQAAPQSFSWGYYDELQSWTWDVSNGQTMKVRVYTRGDQVKLLLNGKEFASNQVTEGDQRRTVFSVPYEPGKLTAVAYKGGREIARKSFTTAGKPAALRLSSDVAKLSTGRDQLAHVLVEVVDAQGRRVPDAVVPVSLKVSGAGALAAVSNANPHNADSFRKPRRHTYHGQALAILRPAKRPGTVTLEATSAGLSAATIDLPVSSPTTHTRREDPRPALATAGFGGGPALLLGAVAAVLARRTGHDPLADR